MLSDVGRCGEIAGKNRSCDNSQKAGGNWDNSQKAGGKKDNNQKARGKGK